MLLEILIEAFQFDHLFTIYLYDSESKNTSTN